MWKMDKGHTELNAVLSFNFKSFAIKTNFFVGKQSQRQICTNTYHIHPLTHIYTYSLTHYIYTFTHT